jgi:simple sugar transport system permease protein
MGNHRQLVLDFVAGAGFTGIAVALMGRNHPFGIIIASLLFGALYQGGGELAFEFQHITKDMIVVMQGLVILFSGALAYMNRPLLEKLWRLYQAQRQRKPAASAVAPLSPAAAPDAPVALAEETVTRVALPAPEAPKPRPAPQPTPTPTPAPAAEVLEVVEAEIVTMGPDAAPTKTVDKLSWLKNSTREPSEAESVTIDPAMDTAGPSGDDTPPPAPAPRKKRGPKKSKRKAGEI